MIDNCGDLIRPGTFYIASRRAGSILEGDLVQVLGVEKNRVNVTVGAYALTEDEFLDIFHGRAVKQVAIGGVFYSILSANTHDVVLRNPDGVSRELTQRDFKWMAKILPLHETYYTLRIGKFPEEEVVTDADGMEKHFATYEEAYDAMVCIYKASVGGMYFTYVKNPIRPTIWKTDISRYGNQVNQMTKQA